MLPSISSRVVLSLALLCSLCLLPSMSRLAKCRTLGLRATGRLSMNLPLPLRINDRLNRMNNGKTDVSRVIDCWDRFIKGSRFQCFVEDNPEIEQVADCYVNGLTPRCFHDVSGFRWALSLGEQYVTIRDELAAYNSRPNPLSTGGGEGDIWLPPRDTSGTAYGPQWKTLGLQDRGLWDHDKISFFPKTVQLLQKTQTPSCEVFFAKQGPNSGILPHTDKNNFIITCHIPLDVPEGQCWIKVGNETHYWKNGEPVIFDTSITHSTRNDADRERYVLLIRFWHPELTHDEINAFKFIFDCLDNSELGEEALETVEMKYLLMGKDIPIASTAVTPKTSAEKTVFNAPIARTTDSSVSNDKRSRGQRDKGVKVKGKGFGAR